MALKGKASSGGGDGPVEVLEADTYDGVLVAVIDLGQHDTNFGRKRQVLLVWELAGHRRADGKAWYVGYRYTLSFDKKAKLRQHFETQRRKKYAEGEEIDPATFLGSLWQLTVSNEEKEKDGKKRTYWDLQQVGAPRKGMAAPATDVQPFLFDCETEDPAPDGEWLPRVYGAKVSDLVAQGRRNMLAPARPGGMSAEQLQADAEEAF